MNVLGMGIICAQGCGVESFRRALDQKWQKPAEIEDPCLPEGMSYAYVTDTEKVIKKSLVRKMRRSDKLSKMAVLAASEAIHTSGIENVDSAFIGIITATAFGPHVTTFNFIDDLLEYGESKTSPTCFSNSVHNASTSYISSTLDIRGPTITVTQFFFSFHRALQLARSWLNENRCDYVLLGAVEQYGNVLGYIYNNKLRIAPDGRIKPFDFNPTFQVPGEGAVYFLLSNLTTKNVFCEVGDIIMGADEEYECPVDLTIIDTDGLLSDESVYRKVFSDDIPVAAYSPLFGSIMTGSAFNFAVAVLTLRDQIKFANPIKDNPHGINIINDTSSSNVEFIQCIRYNCSGDKAIINLNKL